MVVRVLLGWMVGQVSDLVPTVGVVVMAAVTAVLAYRAWAEREA